MNVIGVNRALRATRAKVEGLEVRRARATNKTLWDKKNGNKLHTARRHMVKLISVLQAALQAQGQYSHRPAGYNSPPKDYENE